MYAAVTKKAEEGAYLYNTEEKVFEWLTSRNAVTNGTDL